MNSIDDFLILLQDDLGLPVTGADVGAGLDRVPGWDFGAASREVV